MSRLTKLVGAALLGGAAAGAYYGFSGRAPAIPPASWDDAYLWACAAGAVPALLEAVEPPAVVRKLVPALKFLAAIFVPIIVLAKMNESIGGFFATAAACAAGSAAWLIVDYIGSHAAESAPVLTPAVFSATLGTSALALFFGGSLKQAEFAACMAAACAVPAAPWQRVRGAFGPSLPIPLCALVAVLSAGCYYSDLPRWSAVLLAAAPLGAAVRPLWASFAWCGALCAAAAVIAGRSGGFL